VRARATALLASALLAAGALPLRAQEDRHAPFVVQLAPSVRALGMGGQWVAGSDPDALFFNPALAATQTATSVGFGRYAAASTLAHAAWGMSFGGRGIALGAAALDYQARPGAPLSWRALGEHGSQRALSSVASAAGSLTFRGIRLGAAAKYVEERVGNIRDGGAAFDFGAAKDVASVTVGLSVQNVGASFDVGSVDAHLPLRVAAGVSGYGLRVGPLDFGSSVGASVRRDGFVAGGGGVELGYVPLDGYQIVVRAGAHRPEARSLNPVTLGGTFEMDRFALDYAFEELRAAGGVHHLGIRVR
jgi:hypothetical protein